MKLTIERLNQLTAEDSGDLLKIWPSQRSESWRETIQNDVLFVARFNDRLLGAAKVRTIGRENTGHEGEILDLTVREITRRRGVGSYLLEELQQQMPQVIYWHLPYHNIPSAQYETMNHFMLRNGFQRTRDCWERHAPNLQDWVRAM